MPAKILQLEQHPHFKAPPTAEPSLATRFGRLRPLLLSSNTGPGRALELQQANSLPERMSGAISKSVELEEYEAAVLASLGNGAR